MIQISVYVIINITTVIFLSLIALSSNQILSISNWLTFVVTIIKDIIRIQEKAFKCTAIHTCYKLIMWNKKIINVDNE